MYDRNPSDATHLHHPAHEVPWSVNVSDDETRTMTAAEIAMAASRGELDANDTYVWREGMGDWLPLGQCPELQAVIAQYGGAALQAPPQPSVPPGGYGSVAPPPSAAPYGQTPYGDDEDLGATRVADEGLGGTLMANAPTHDEVSRTMASAAYGDDEDVFAAARPATSHSSPPISSRLTGARNEESSLFSIDDLRRAADAKQAAARAAPPGRRPAQNDDDPFADLLSGAGGLAFEPPPLHAPAPPPPPPKPAPQPIVAAPAVAPAPMGPASMGPASMGPASMGPASMGPASIAPMAAQASTYPMSMAQPQKSKTGLLIGAAAGVVLLTGAAIAFMVSGGDDDAPQAKADAAGETTPADKPAKGSETAADEGDDEAAEDAKKDDDEAEATAKKDDDEGDAKSDGPEKDDDKATTKTSAVTSAPADKTAKDDKVASTKTDKKADDKKDAKKDEPAKPAGEFNRDAARSALNAAAGAASGCKKPGGPTGKGQVTVTFAPSGRATQATVSAPFAGTPVGSCAAGAFRTASVPPFTGSSVTVSKSFFIK